MLSKIYTKFLSLYLDSVFQQDMVYFQSKKELIERISTHQEKMPDYLLFFLRLFTALYLTTIFFINKFLLNKTALIIINSSRNSKILMIRNFIRFHDSLFVIADVKEKLYNKQIGNNSSIKKLDLFDYVIVGSGPGGSIMASKLKQAGYHVCIFEKGDDFRNENIGQFSYNEMIKMYNHSGLTTTFGNCNMAYAEGSLFGGGSEVNSGLYHQPSEDLLERWGKKFNLIESRTAQLKKYFKIIEKDLNISYFPNNNFPKASLMLKDGAKKLNWDVAEIPRWFKFDNKNSITGKRMTMSKTYLGQFISQGGNIYDKTEVKKIKYINRNWSVYYKSNKKYGEIIAKNVILSAGAIGTPIILKKSNILNNVKKNIQMHPTIKVVALFNNNINYDNMGVPVHQVREFYPEYSFGCSISSQQYLRASMLDHYENINIVKNEYKKMAIYYVMISPEGVGKVTNVPFFSDPIILYKLTNKDKTNLAIGLKNLCKLLKHSGAIELYPSIYKSTIVKEFDDIEKLPSVIDTSITSLMSVHLFSSCPMGEKKDICITDSFGKVHGYKNLYICDASILPSAPGINPQGTIMTFAHRNADKLINKP